PLRAARHSSKRRTTTKNDGTNSTARQVEASMPLNTAMPIDLRELAPAPVASTSGNTPRMKAKEVMRMGRKRARAASSAASTIGLPGRGAVGDLLHQRHRLAGTEARRRQSHHRRRRIEVVEAEQGRTDDRGDVNHGANRDDGALLVANRKLLDVLRPQTELGIRLHLDLEDAA